MKDLIEALTIFAKYQELEWPTNCEHDVLMIMGITEEEVSPLDKEFLDNLGFCWNESYECWVSYRFGSA